MFDKLLRSLTLHFCKNEYIETEIPCKLAKRIYYDFPVRQWQPGERLIVLGQSLDKEIIIDLSSEDTPHIQIVGASARGKTNLLRAIAYCLVMQDLSVSVCGQFFEYKDLTDQFTNITINEERETFVVIEQYFYEYLRRSQMNNLELAQQPARILLIDGYLNSIFLDDQMLKVYEQQLCAILRRGRGVKIHVVIASPKNSIHSNNNGLGLPSRLAQNLPCLVTFSCVSTVNSIIAVRHHQEITPLLGCGNGIVQSSLLNTRFQAYRFDTMPD